MKKQVAVFASGNGTNAERLFQYFEQHPDIRVAVLFCNRPDANVLNRADRYQVPTEVFDRAGFAHVPQKLEDYQVDWIVLAGFLWLMPQVIVRAYPGRIINLHPALLPKYGGKGMYGHHVHEAVLQSGDTKSGITIHLIDEEYDKGEVVFQASCRVEPNDTADSLAAKIHELEYRHLPETVEKLILGETAQH